MTVDQVIGHPDGELSRMLSQMLFHAETNDLRSAALTGEAEHPGFEEAAL